MDPSENSLRPYILKAGQGWKYRFGIDFTVKSSEISPGSSAAILEYETRAGEEPPSHTHASEDEMFYVLEGAITFHCADESFDLEKGGFIFLPHAIQHGYTIRGTDPVRLLVITAPIRPGQAGGWNGFVADLELGQGQLIENPPHQP